MRSLSIALVVMAGVSSQAFCEPLAPVRPVAGEPLPVATVVDGLLRAGKPVLACFVDSEQLRADSVDECLNDLLVLELAKTRGWASPLLVVDGGPRVAAADLKGLPEGFLQSVVGYLRLDDSVSREAYRQLVNSRLPMVDWASPRFAVITADQRESAPLRLCDAILRCLEVSRKPAAVAAELGQAVEQQSELRSNLVDLLRFCAARLAQSENRLADVVAQVNTYFNGQTEGRTDRFIRRLEARLMKAEALPQSARADAERELAIVANVAIKTCARAPDTVLGRQCLAVLKRASELRDNWRHWPQAKDLAAQIATTIGEPPRMVPGTAELLPWAQYELAKCCYQLDEYHEAVAACDEMLATFDAPEATPDSDGEVDLRWKTYFLLGSACEQLGDIGRAALAFQEVIPHLTGDSQRVAVAAAIGALLWSGCLDTAERLAARYGNDEGFDPYECYLKVGDELAAKATQGQTVYLNRARQALSAAADHLADQANKVKALEALEQCYGKLGYVDDERECRERIEEARADLAAARQTAEQPEPPAGGDAQPAPAADKPGQTAEAADVAGANGCGANGGKPANADGATTEPAAAEDGNKPPTPGQPTPQQDGKGPDGAEAKPPQSVPTEEPQDDDAKPPQDAPTGEPKSADKPQHDGAKPPPGAPADERKD